MISHIMNAIRCAESEPPIDSQSQTILTGFSGTKLIGALQRLAQSWDANPDACYLEIGVFQGLTLLSVAASNPQLACYGIDNFAYFDLDGKNFGLVEERRRQLNATNARIINLDYEDALENLATHIEGRKVGVFFIDGPHDYRSQLMCLELALPCLHEQAVIVIDDCNYRHVRQANRDFLVTHPEYALVFEAYTARHPSNMSQDESAAARAGWWNGVNVITRDPGGTLTRTYPPTFRNRNLFENEHFVHAANVAPQVVQAVRVAQMLDAADWRGLAKAIFRLYRDLRSTRGQRRGLYRSLNTYSDTLPASRYCDASGADAPPCTHQGMRHPD